jgi:hypothetical protein
VINSVAGYRRDCQARPPNEAAIIHPMAEAKARLRDEVNKERERSCNPGDRTARRANFAPPLSHRLARLFLGLAELVGLLSTR